MRDSNLPPPSKLIALTLGTHTGSKCRRPFVSISTLVAETSLARSTVLHHLKLLTDEDGRFVQRTDRYDASGRQTSNEYRLTLPTDKGRVQEMDPGVRQLDGRGSISRTEEGLADGPEGGNKEGTKKKDHSVERVWAHYVSRYGQRYSIQRAQRLKLTAAGRDRKIRARLREGYAPDDLCTAIDGNFGDHWHRERDKHELEYVLRNQSKVEDFLNRAERNGGPDSSRADGNAISSRRDALAGLYGDEEEIDGD